MTTPDDFGNIHKDSGSPEGGQFAKKRNSRPSGELSDEQVRAANDTIMGPARMLARSFRIDETNAEDIAQDAWVDLLSRKNRTIDDLVNDKPLLKLVSRTIANRDYTVAGAHGLRHEDMQARRALREREAEFAAKNGRKMTPDERKAAADAIRMAAQPGRRPKDDFYVEKQTLSLDASLDSSTDDGITLGDGLVAEDGIPFDAQEDAAASALHAVEGGMARKADVRRDMWRIVTISNGAPQVVPSSVTPTEARRHRKVVEESGGVHALAERWGNGETTPEEDAALFAPFGDIDMSGRSKAAGVLSKHSTFADGLWGDAMKVAARR